MSGAVFQPLVPSFSAHWQTAQPPVWAVLHLLTWLAMICCLIATERFCLCGTANRSNHTWPSMRHGAGNAACCTCLQMKQRRIGIMAACGCLHMLFGH